MRYKQQQTKNQTLRKLLDTKMHLFYAEHDLAKGRDADAIRKELKFTDRYLEEALSEAEPPERERISELRKEVRALEADLNGDSKQAIIRYEQAMVDLRQLIQEH